MSPPQPQKSLDLPPTVACLIPTTRQKNRSLQSCALYGQRLSSEEWKDVFTAALKRAKVVPGLDGGFVVCGQSTSRMTKAEMAELQTLMEAFGAEREVQFRAWEGEQ